MNRRLSLLKYRNRVKNASELSLQHQFTMQLFMKKNTHYIGKNDLELLLLLAQLLVVIRSVLNY